MGYDPNRWWNKPAEHIQRKECGGHDHLGNTVTLCPQADRTPEVRSGKLHNYASRAHMDHIIFDRAGIPLSTPVRSPPPCQARSRPLHTLSSTPSYGLF